MTPTCVTLVTVADDLPVPVILVAGSSKVAAAVGPLGTRARPALAAGREAQHGVAVVTVGAPANKEPNYANIFPLLPPSDAVAGRERPPHRSHLSPPVLSLQPRQAPVLCSHCSVCPLHWHGRQLGKPQCPAWQPSQRWPNAPGRHLHRPENLSQKRDTEPSRLQPQAARWKLESVGGDF